MENIIVHKPTHMYIFSFEYIYIFKSYIYFLALLKSLETTMNQ